MLSNPSLVVVDNQEATLEVGDQVPVSTGSATVLSANNAVVNTIDYKNTGIILRVLPRVKPDNIVLDIEQEITSVSPAASYADADDLGAQSQELDHGDQRPDGAARRPDRESRPSRARAFRSWTRSPAWATRFRNRT